jgi:predicted transcriptional regulator
MVAQMKMLPTRKVPAVLLCRSMTSKEQIGRTISRALALGIVLISGHVTDSHARSWIEGAVRYVEIKHAGFDMAQGSQVGAAKCRRIFGEDKLLAQSSGQLSRAAYLQLTKTIGMRIRISGMQRDTEELASGLFRTRCNAADENISVSFKQELSRADIAKARLQAGVETIAIGRHREGIDMLTKLRGEPTYRDALPAIVAGLIKVNVRLAMEIDQQYVRLDQADFAPALIQYEDASSKIGWVDRAREAAKRLDELSR